MDTAPPNTGFSPDRLRVNLARDARACPGARLKVAYSGGLDSHVLLHALAELREREKLDVSAIHVNHSLHANAEQWVLHCRAVCAALDVPLIVERIEVPRGQGEGLESAARRARYAVLARHISGNDALLTAHHRDDQAETLLLQLLRGAGPHGLAAMPALAPFSAGFHLRPLLDFGRDALKEYARERHLHWIEDTSNLDTRIARNFLRHRALPMLASHWPAAAQCLARAARHCGEAAEILDESAAMDARACRAGNHVLDLGPLARLSPERQRNLLRWWSRRAEGHAPQKHLLDEIARRIETEPATRHASVRLAHGAVCRYKDRLWYVPSEPGARTPEPMIWNPALPLVIPGATAQLRAIETIGAGLSRARLHGTPLQIRFRSGGETLQPAGRGEHRKLKKLLQESGLAPWQRARLPLLYASDRLAAVGDRWIADEFAAREGEPGLVLLIEKCG